MPSQRQLTCLRGPCVGHNVHAIIIRSTLTLLDLSSIVSQPWKAWYETNAESKTAGMSLWPMYIAGNQVNGKIAPLGIDLGTPKPKPTDL